MRLGATSPSMLRVLAQAVLFFVDVSEMRPIHRALCVRKKRSIIIAWYQPSYIAGLNVGIRGVFSEMRSVFVLARGRRRLGRFG